MGLGGAMQNLLNKRIKKNVEHIKKICNFNMIMAARLGLTNNI